MLKKVLLFSLVLIIGFCALVYSQRDKLIPSPTIEESPTTIIGFNHIGISVIDIDKMLDFYQRATNFKLIKREKIRQSEGANKLFGQDSISYEVAILKAPNMLLELTQFENQTDTIIEKMPPYGPGMTHTCYQSAEINSGYGKFVNAGVDMLSRGDKPIDLGGYGVTYAYAHDPEGNLVELEQMSNFVIRIKIGKSWSDKNKMWMTQVAIMSPNIEKLTAFYQDVLEIKPYRVNSYPPSDVSAQVIALDGVSMKGAWFMLDGRDKKMELFQYEDPYPTPNSNYIRKPTDLGYTYSFEVLDIQKEYERLKSKGVKFVSRPQDLGEYWMVYANDIDGNVFSLRQAVDPSYSLVNF